MQAKTLRLAVPKVGEEANHGTEVVCLEGTTH